MIMMIGWIVMEYDSKSMYMPIMSLEEFKSLQGMKGIKLSVTEFTQAYLNYMEHAKRLNETGRHMGDG